MRLLDVAQRHGDGERVWAIEDCRQRLRRPGALPAQGGGAVVRVPPKMMASERKVARAARQVGCDRRDSRSRARRCASTTCRSRWLAGPEREIAWLVDYRARSGRRVAPGSAEPAALAAARPRPGPAPPASRAGQRATRSSRSRGGWRRSSRPRRSAICRDRVGRLRELNPQIKALERELAPLVASRARRCWRSPAAA